MTLTRRLIAASVLAFASSLALLTFLAARGAPPAPLGGALAALPDAPHAGATTDRRIAILQATVRADPKQSSAWTQLAAADLQKVRETGDAGFYARAAGAVDRALAIAPGDPGALTQRAALELARHDFRAALVDAQRAHRLAPAVNKPYGALVDALVELGRYAGAGRVLQEMVDRRPDLAAYARVSYFRELHGDLDGAMRAMELAVSAGGDVPENAAYVRTLLGGLELQRGRVGSARRAYREALAQVPGYVPALAGLARADVARGRLGPAIARLRHVVARLPLPEHVIALAEAERADGRTAASARDIALVRVEQRLLARAGVNTDVELALFESDHGDPARGVKLARRAWAAAPSVRSADALGWALTRSGAPRAGLRWADRALALGSRDASFLAHAGLAARAAGRPARARRLLRSALAANPRFSALLAPEAARALRELGR
jgi:tetratricopeptide (TPR) repeat protein